MSISYRTLFQNIQPRGVVTHSDILNQGRPCVLSRERAKKVGALMQKEMEDPGGYEKCRLCHPELLDGKPTIKKLLNDKVGAFSNAAPYLPHDQHVIFVRHDNPLIMEKELHIFKSGDIRTFELYYLLNGCISLGREFAKRQLSTTDLPRMITGFNIGPLAGQSLPHIHVQYGWEIVLDRMDISQTVIKLFFEELQDEDLIIHSEDKHDSDDLELTNFKFVAPWTPRGQYAVDIYFNDRYEIHSLTDADCKLFAVLGYSIIQKYHDLGIRNLNIVFDSSPHGRRIIPVIAHFVPRINQPAIYELLGRDVVDTPPPTIFNTFLPLVPKWPEMLEKVKKFNPDAEYNKVASQAIE